MHRIAQAVDQGVHCGERSQAADGKDTVIGLAGLQAFLQSNLEPSARLAS